MDVRFVFNCSQSGIVRKEKKMRNPLKISGSCWGFFALDLAPSELSFRSCLRFPFIWQRCSASQKAREQLHYLVYGNRPLQKTSGQFCAEQSHDAWNQMQDHRHGDRSYGHRIYLHEKCACGKNLHSRCVGMPHFCISSSG